MGSHPIAGFTAREATSNNEIKVPVVKCLKKACNLLRVVLAISIALNRGSVAQANCLPEGQPESATHPEIDRKPQNPRTGDSCHARCVISRSIIDDENVVSVGPEGFDYLSYRGFLVKGRHDDEGGGTSHYSSPYPRTCPPTRSLTTISHSIILGVIGVLLLATAFVLMRRGRLAVRYGFGWAAVGLIAILLAPLLPLIEPIAAALSLTVPGLIIAVGAIFLAIVALQVSITLSSMHEQIRLLAERSAVLEVEATESCNTSAPGHED